MKSLIASLTVAMCLASGHALASPTFGALSNFDIVNDTGETPHGFEIELEDVHSLDICYTFSAQRYGEPVLVNTIDASGKPVLFIRHMSPYSAELNAFTVATPIPTTKITAEYQAECYIGGFGSPPYATSGCEHFGVCTTKNPTRTVYRWLVADPAHPGSLIPAAGGIPIPAPVYAVSPPIDPAVNAAPRVAAVIAAPPIEVETHLQYGEAQWVKVFKSESVNPVDLNALQSDNPLVVPMDPTQTEVEWKIMQVGPAGVNNEEVNEAPVGAGNHSVIRRYEIYKYTGEYDPESHEVMCVDSGCDVPGPNEVGDFVGAQMAAINLNLPEILAPSTLPKGEVGMDYGQQVLVTGGSQPYDIVVTDSLPAGLLLDSATGVLSGVPTAAGNSSFSIDVTDVDGMVTSGSFNLTVASSVSISTATLPAGTVGKAYSTKLTAAGGVSPYTWVMTSGALPAGLTFSAGSIAGTPPVAATVNLGFSVTDALGAVSQKTLGLTIATTTATTCSVPAGSKKAEGKATITAVGAGYIKVGAVTVKYLDCTTKKFNDVPAVFTVGLPAQWKGYSVKGVNTATLIEVN